MLEYAYAGNILVVTPVIYLLWFAEDGAEKVFGARMQLSSAMQTLVASMWTAIVLVSIAGLKWERELVGLLVFQCVYKLIFICVYVVPRARARDWDAIPGAAGRDLRPRAYRVPAADLRTVLDALRPARRAGRAPAKRT